MNWQSRNVMNGQFHTTGNENSPRLSKLFYKSRKLIWHIAAISGYLVMFIKSLIHNTALGNSISLITQTK